MIDSYLKFSLYSFVWLSLIWSSGCATVSERSHQSNGYPSAPQASTPASRTKSVEEYVPSRSTKKERVKKQESETTAAESKTAPLPMPAIPSVPVSDSTADSPNQLNALESSTFNKKPQVALAAHQDNCLPQLQEWKVEFTRKAELTDDKLNALQTELNQSKELLVRMETEQNRSKTEVERLKLQLDFYRKEVTRLEQLMETQHASDLVILDSLTNKLEGLLERSRSY